MPRILDDYLRAARRAYSAGFDGVEVLSANGYLLDQFLQAKTNRREPGLVERFANGWPLAPEAGMQTWHTPREGGYIDWPTFAG